MKSGNLNFLEPSGPLQTCNGTALPFFFLMSDEANFRVLDFVNKFNMRYWVAVHPRELHEQALHSPKVTVRCAVATFWVLGAFFFEALKGYS